MLNWRREFEKRFLKRGWAMSGKFKFTLLFLLLSTVAFSHSNQWIQIQSRLTGEELKASVVLPPGYEEDARRYPVLYFLHGWESSPFNLQLLLDWGELLAELCAQGKASPFIIVIPESGDAGRSWYSDYTDGRAYEGYLIKELIPFIDRNFRTIPTPKGRGIAGFSMGGFGAFKLIAKYPHLFGSASSVSGILSLETLTFGWKLTPLRLFSNTFRHLSEEVFGLTVEDWQRNDPKTLLVRLAENLPQVYAQRSFFVVVGNKDEFFCHKHAEELVAFFSETGADYVYLKVPGGRHNFFFLRSCLDEVFQFHSEKFTAISPMLEEAS
ncbi:MAG: hypothetical protein GX766_07385 [Firmicutes bacterium]|jgi:S-formylglutathione hydrolase FrmB|nr:hypothetical protein [Bacillota bacterium]HOB21704.1 alpha/beta hydrolase family protein [Bacillota bacterium]HQD39164.1 alpha/beta hydrolase family protein [Bacillota bacterium]